MTEKTTPSPGFQILSTETYTDGNGMEITIYIEEPINQDESNEVL